MNQRGGRFVQVGLAGVAVAFTAGCSGMSGTRASVEHDPMHTTLAAAEQTARPGRVRQRGASDSLGRAVFMDRPPAATAVASVEDQ